MVFLSHFSPCAPHPSWHPHADAAMVFPSNSSPCAPHPSCHPYADADADADMVSLPHLSPCALASSPLAYIDHPHSHPQQQEQPLPGGLRELAGEPLGLDALWPLLDPSMPLPIHPAVAPPACRRPDRTLSDRSSLSTAKTFGSPLLPVASIKGDEQEDEIVVEASSQHQQNIVAEISAQQWRGKRAKSRACFSTNPSNPPRTRKKSKVWLEFKKISEGADEVLAECMHCHKVLRAPSRNGTSSLLRHLNKVHPTNGAEYRSRLMKSEKSVDNSLSTLISMFLLGGTHPFTVVEEQGFKTMMGAQLKNISRHTIRRHVLVMFQMERKDMIETLSCSPGRISFTLDRWKSDATKYHYICITAHYIDSEWRLHKRLIWFKKLNPPYDAACVADEVHSCFCEWKIDSKIMCITLDDASYNDSMISTLRTHLVLKDPFPFLGSSPVRCWSNILNLVVQAGLKLIDKSLVKLREGIEYIVSSVGMHKFYDTADKILQLDVTRKLHVDMPVSWDSTYTMIDNALYFKDIWFCFAEMDSTFKLNFMPSLEEWKRLSTMHEFLKTLYDVTCIFSGMKHPTSNLYLKCAFMVHKHFIDSLSKAENFMIPMVREMKTKFDKYWTDYSTALSCAAILDPRYKLKLVSYCYMKLYGEKDAKHRIDEVRLTMQNIFEGYHGSVVSSSAADLDASNAPGYETSGCFSDYSQFLSVHHSQEKSQLDLYLDEPPRGWNENLDVLDYWSKESVRYPELALMARDILAIPIATVASGFDLSTSPKVITPNWSSLKSKTIEALICLQDWHRGGTNEGSASTKTIILDEETSDSE